MNHEDTVMEAQILAALARYENLEWFIAMGASEFVSAPLNKIAEVAVSKLFELRAFNKEHEIRAVRGNLGEVFQLRDSLCYNQQEDNDIFCMKEEHFLDIDVHKYIADAERTSEKAGFVIVSTMTGGTYGLPNRNVKKVEIENYYYPDEKGFYYPFDFRIVRFLEVSK